MLAKGMKLTTAERPAARVASGGQTVKPLKPPEQSDRSWRPARRTKWCLRPSPRPTIRFRRTLGGASVEWLPDNGSTLDFAAALGLAPCFTPVQRPSRTALPKPSSKRSNAATLASIHRQMLL